MHTYVLLAYLFWHQKKFLIFYCSLVGVFSNIIHNIHTDIEIHAFKKVEERTICFKCIQQMNNTHTLPYRYTIKYLRMNEDNGRVNILREDFKYFQQVFLFLLLLYIFVRQLVMFLSTFNKIAFSHNIFFGDILD